MRRLFLLLPDRRDPVLKSPEIRLRISVGVLESLNAIAPLRGLSGYQTLLKSCIGEGLWRDEAKFAPDATAPLIEALKRGVLDAAMRDPAAA
jgi:hypothetical protein